MSLKAKEWARNVHHKKPAHKAIMSAIAEHTNKDTGISFPSIIRICIYTGYGKSTVLRNIDEMEDLGILSADRKDGKLTKYRLNLEWGELFDFRDGRTIEKEPVPLRDQLETRTSPGAGLDSNLTGPAPGPVQKPNRSRSGRQPVPERDLTGPGAGPKPFLTLNKPRESLSPESKTDFEEFFNCHPRATAKPKTYQAYLEARDKADHETIMCAARAYAAERKDQASRYTMKSAKWLDDESWDDQPDNSVGPCQANNVWPGAELFVEEFGIAVWNSWLADTIYQPEDGAIEVATKFIAVEIKKTYLGRLEEILGQRLKLIVKPKGAEATNVWPGAEDLVADVGADFWNSWFGKYAFSEDGVIVTENQFQLNWLNRNHEAEVKKVEAWFEAQGKILNLIAADFDPKKSASGALPANPENT